VVVVCFDAEFMDSDCFWGPGLRPAALAGRTEEQVIPNLWHLVQLTVTEGREHRSFSL